jgi:hypothetical protein
MLSVIVSYQLHYFTTQCYQLVLLLSLLQLTHLLSHPGSEWPPPRGLERRLRPVATENVCVSVAPNTTLLPPTLTVPASARLPDSSSERGEEGAEAEAEGDECRPLVRRSALLLLAARRSCSNACSGGAGGSSQP